MKQDKKELIRVTAIDIFARLGFFNTTTDKIAQEAGVAVGTIYNYFRSKDEILEYIFLVELQKRKEFYEQAITLNMSFTDRVRHLLRKHFDEIAKKPEVGQILVRERQFPNKNDLTAITKYLDGIPKLLGTMLHQAQETGEIRPCDTRIVGASLFGAVQGIVSLAVFEDDDSVRSCILENAADELADLFFDGLVATR